MVAETSKAETSVTTDDDTERRILKAYRETRRFTSLLSMNRVLEQLGALLRGISTAEDLKHALQSTLPFLGVYQNIAQNQLAIHAQWTKALFKLDYVLCSTLMRLSKEGFCQPLETEEAGGGEGEAMEAADGTGFGEGSGTENMGKDIEDESQVEGLKGEDEGNQEGGKDEGDDNALEMSEDFGGALEDVPDDGAQGENDDQSDAESEADPEERIENLDPSDPSALDEKIWGDESGPQDSDDMQDKTGKDHSEDQSGDSEIVAKENNKKSNRDREKEQGKDSEAKDQNEVAQNIEDQAEVEEEEGEPNAAGAPTEDHAQGANILDLPDDMELDVGEEEKEKNMIDEELEAEYEEDMLDEKAMEMELDDETPFDKTVDDVERDVPQDEAVDDEDMEMGNSLEARTDDDHPEADNAEKDAPSDEVTARPDASTGDGTVNPNDETQAQTQDVSSTGQAGSSAANTGQKNITQEKAEQTG
jgi:midasin